MVRLWKEKRGETPDLDLSGELIVQLGLVTEDLNRRWFERNAGHKIVQRMELARTADKATFEDLSWLLLDQARILEGGSPEDPAKFAERMNRLLLAGT